MVWVAALLAAMLSVGQLYAADLADGSLEQMLLADPSRLRIAAAKAASHWLLTGLPLAIAAPLFGLMLGLPGDAIVALVLTLLLGTPILSLLGGLGAALTLGLRGGAVLLIVLIVPLCIPVLIFGVAVIGAPAGSGAAFLFLSAISLVSVAFCPFAAALALRVSGE